MLITVAFSCPGISFRYQNIAPRFCIRITFLTLVSGNHFLLYKVSGVVSTTRQVGVFPNLARCTHHPTDLVQ